MAETSDTSDKIGIGALAKATGIPTETLRTWERRYGFPNPDRTPAGHRLYSPAIVDRLKLVGRALDAGHRASKVVPRDVDGLRELLGLHDDLPSAPDDPWSVRDPAHSSVEAWLRAASSFDGDALESAMRNAWHTLGALSFLSDRVAPFLHELGVAWAEKRMDVAHEHFASERLRDFLTAHWRPLSDRSRGPKVVCTTLPGEAHNLGLQIAATVLAVAGCRVTYLGSDTPVADIASVVNTQSAKAVLLSVSIASNRFMVSRDITTIRASVGGDVQVVIGGRGAPDALPGVSNIGEIEDLHTWAVTLAGTQ